MMLSQSSGSLTCSTIRIMEFPDKDINPPPLSHGILTDSGALSEHSYNEEEYLSPQRLVSVYTCSLNVLDSLAFILIDKMVF